jgi:rhamnose transport system substrate-binding protein
MRRKRIMLLLGVAAIAALVAVFAAAVGSAGPTRADAKGKGYKIFLLPKNIGNPVFTTNNRGAQEAARELGDKVTYNGPTEAVASKQVPFIDTAVRQGFNAIIISANDPNAVAPALKRAAARGVKVISYDSDTAPDARTIFVSGPDQKSIGFAQVEWLGSQIGYKGDFAILSATPTATNQNAWIKYMKQALKMAKYKNMKLVKIAYGNDNDTKSLQEAQGLLQAYPDLKGIIAPTTVGIAAAARVVSQARKCSSVRVTGLGFPSQMKSYVKSGCVKKFGLWNEIDFGYVAVQVAHAVLDGKLTGKAGESFIAGRAGKRTVGKDGVMIGVPPYAFTKGNIDKAGF